MRHKNLIMLFMVFLEEILEDKSFLIHLTILCFNIVLQCFAEISDISGVSHFSEASLSWAPWTKKRCQKNAPRMPK